MFGATAGREDALPDGFERDSRTLVADTDGYLQAVDAEALLGIARSRDLVVRLDRRPGDYVSCGMPLASTWPEKPIVPLPACAITISGIASDEEPARYSAIRSRNTARPPAARSIRPTIRGSTSSAGPTRRSC